MSQGYSINDEMYKSRHEGSPSLSWKSSRAIPPYLSRVTSTILKMNDIVLCWPLILSHKEYNNSLWIDNKIIHLKSPATAP